MGESTNTIDIPDVNEDSFTIRFGNGRSHTIDPLEVLTKLATIPNLEADFFEHFRKIIGLPQLPITKAADVWVALSRHLEELKKKRPWMQTLHMPTACATPAPPASDSTSTYPGSAPSESSSNPAPLP